MYVDGGNKIVVPKKIADGKPWVWRARFFGHQPQFDIAMLNKGYHVVYCDVGGLYGSDEAVKRWDDYYKYLNREHLFADRAILEGFSRGGLIIYRWASKNPDKVDAMYGDAPVMDFKSWPYNKSQGDWAQCCKTYGMTEEEALKFKGNPLDVLAPLAQAKIPIIHVVGDVDKVVPIAENTSIAEKRYKEKGGVFEVIHKKDCGHHPHSLPDPAPIVDFVMKHTKGKSAGNADSLVSDKNFHLRGNYNNSRIQFETKKKGHVVFIGGSITFMDGYRPMVCEMLKKRFPDTEFTFTAAGVSSTCSTTGAGRLKRDVLSKGPLDLFFIEFAVNDDQDAHHSREDCIRGMEGIIAQARKHNPCCDIVVTHFVNPGMIMKLQKGEKPISNTAHSDVAKHYNISVNDLAQELTDQITAGKMDWKQFGGVHPNKYGNTMCATMISNVLLEEWKKPLKSTAKVKHKIPALLDEKSYIRGRFLEMSDIKQDGSWKISVPAWDRAKHGSLRDEFKGVEFIHSETPGAKMTIPFQGTAIGTYMLAGPDSAMVKVSVDDGKAKEIETLHGYSGFPYPRTVMFFNDLSNGSHTLKLEILENKAGRIKKGGTALRVMHFMAN